MINKEVLQEYDRVTYPVTAKKIVTDEYFGITIADPYRWLEDNCSVETSDWVAEQNRVTEAYLNQIPFREKLQNRLTELWNYEKTGAPFKEGAYTYFFRNNGLQNQSVLYRKCNKGQEEVFLDPNTFSEDGSASLGGLDFSSDGSILAYAVSEAGSDWRKVCLVDTVTGKMLEPALTEIKFSGIAWKGNEGFFYSSYDKPNGSELSAMTDQHKLYYHRLGTLQKEDKVIFGLTEKRRYVSGYVTEDDRYLIISAANTTYGNELYLIDLQLNDNELVTIVNNMENSHYVLDNDEESLLIVTDMDAPNVRIMRVAAEAPYITNWQELVAETNNVLEPLTGGGYIFAHYMKDAVSMVTQYDYNGGFVRNITLPGLGTVSGFRGKKKVTDLYYTFTNYITAGAIYGYNGRTGDSFLYEHSKAKFDTDQYVSQQVFYTAKDGVQIPMMITAKKGVPLSGQNPTILYGYGGFNVSLTPSFSIANAVWLENGGIYAVPNIRGGGEYGKAWHVAGTQLQKQQVFEDFIAAAEYLIAAGYTSPSFLAIKGGSNGGLLVAACMLRRPELFKVVLPAVGVLDMLRYHTFTAGAGWSYDYGTADQSEEMFEYLRSYSPVHNVKNNVEYPATLITTGDHDDRVVPAHSFKFAAVLQEKQTGNNPVMIRIEVNAGHGAGKPLAKVIAENADIMAFTLYNMKVAYNDGGTKTDV